ncbi:YgaP family membrane protein [Desmospora activa]|uniref:Inner membrane protein YgaP-like transmembrane domain-containing protein n=1 Tax=Desmospora activa DSM 45169 TaxID=1121389 RepID=A0A2T4Z6G8_9BACL|nr:DUF2892 domain-containing protein [Desmospora activa]PTM57482.1 Protein of unknown function (DUF2892) [Desmospora activa DSM 45169]
MQKNVGTIDALLRITFGLAGLAWSAARLTRRTDSIRALFIAILAGMKVAEGITRFCPMLHFIGVSSKEVR